MFRKLPPDASLWETLTADRGTPLPEHVPRAVDLLKLYNLPYTWESGPYMYDGETLFLGNMNKLRKSDLSPNIIHEFAHWVVAPDHRKSFIDFGLGKGPDSKETAPYEKLYRKERDFSISEEEMASALGIFVQWSLGIPIYGTLQTHGWTHTYHTPDEEKNIFRGVVVKLRKHLATVDPYLREELWGHNEYCSTLDTEGSCSIPDNPVFDGACS